MEVCLHLYCESCVSHQGESCYVVEIVPTGWHTGDLCDKSQAGVILMVTSAMAALSHLV